MKQRNPFDWGRTFAGPGDPGDIKPEDEIDPSDLSEETVIERNDKAALEGNTGTATASGLQPEEARTDPVTGDEVDPEQEAREEQERIEAEQAELAEQAEKDAADAIADAETAAAEADKADEQADEEAAAPTWSTATKHADLDAAVPGDVTLPDGWDDMTIAAKKDWLTANVK